MKIAIISDTHGNVTNFKKVVNWLNKENIKIILHCGDIGDPESLKESLAEFGGDFLGVLGNMDRDYKFEIGKYQQLPKIKVFEGMGEAEINKKKIGFIHDPKAAKTMAESGRYNIVFYGHTHKPWEEKVGECRLANPGEAAGQFYKPTFAVYDPGNDVLELKILETLQ